MAKRQARPGEIKGRIDPDDFCMSKEEREDLAASLSEKLKYCEITQRSIADAWDCSSGHVSQLLSAKSKMSVDEFVFLARLIKHDPGLLLDESLKEGADHFNKASGDFIHSMPLRDLMMLQRLSTYLHSVDKEIDAMIEKRTKEEKRE